MKKFDILFKFRGCEYDAAIRVRENAGMLEYVITVLNWKLERLLYGNHIIKEVDGTLQVNAPKENACQMELKLTIAYRLSEYLGIRVFVDKQCRLGNGQEEGWEDFHPLPRHEHRHHDGSTW